MPPHELPPPTPTPFADLRLDASNPRMADVNMEADDQDGIIRWLWKNKSVDELVQSIAENGYWSHEELFAAEEDGHLVVLEGNRRLAAVKLLMDADLRERLSLTGIPEASPEVIATMETLPVIVSERSTIWDYVGFKHVNGPAAWDSIAKAKYVHGVRRDLDIPLEDIAKTIGDKHDTVKRLYRGYLVLVQAEEAGLFDRADCVQSRFPFSHLWTALGYKNVQDFLGVDTERLEEQNPIPDERLPDLGRFMLWLFGSASQEIDPVIRRQNPDLRKLAEVLGSEDGIGKLSMPVCPSTRRTTRARATSGSLPGR